MARNQMVHVCSSAAIATLVFAFLTATPCPAAGATDLEAGAIAENTTETEAEQTKEEKREKAQAMANLLGRIFGAFDSSAEDEEEDDSFAHLIGQPAAKFELQTPAGEKIRLQDLRGQVVVLDFWATWCGPCLAAMPEVEKVHTHFAGKDVTVIGVNQQDDADAVRATVNDRGVTFTQVLDTDGQVGTSFGVSAIPQTVLIDKEGIIQDIHTGFSASLREKMIGDIEKLLQGENVFDEAKVAAARKRLEEKRAKVAEQIGLHEPQRLERLDDLLADADVSLTNYYNPPQWITLPGENQPALALVTAQNRLTIVRPAGQSETIELEWPEQIGIWDFCPAPRNGKMCWAALGAEYDDDYDIKQFTVSLFGSDGKPLWTQTYVALEEDSNPQVDMTAADLTGDDQPEIALLVEHDGLSTSQLKGPDEATRVLTIYDSSGDTLLRSWVPGSGGAAIFTLPAADGNEILMATSEGLSRFRVKPPAE